MEKKLIVSEIFSSIQGESSFVGLPFTFLRLAGCNLRCSYCDSAYTFSEGEELSLSSVINRIKSKGIPLVEITGGEPLLQEGIYPLIEILLKEGYRVLVETNGSLPIDLLDKRIIKIMDLKCPSSLMSEKMLFPNLSFLNSTDELKFVIGDKRDYLWAKGIISDHDLSSKVKLLFSPVYSMIDPKEIIRWILEDMLPVRFQLQIHKYIWPSNQRGV